MPERPVLLTCGEPAGIGPEIAAKAWRVLRDEMAFCWIGDPRHLPEGCDHVVIDRVGDAAVAMRAAMPVLAHPFAGGAARPGQPDPAHAQGVVDVIARAVDLVQRGEASAVCTAPISKKALKDGAGFAFPGHTEFLAELAGGVDVAMMLVCDALRAVPVTIHIPLREVPAALTADRLERQIRLTHAALIADFGVESPRIAVAGLNPHAGEGGAIGSEEQAMMIPLLDRLRNDGMEIAGPMPADTMFHPAARSKYDAAIAMYHDQALIPVKTLAFDSGVNVTLGLPFVRTSPDHGTAFDIAGQDRADPTSLVAALRLARDMAARRVTPGIWA